jgi:nitrate/nitrite-specific signal transduction histidine kinase
MASGRVRAEIRDDGIGFDPRRARLNAIGLTGMQERAAGVGGTIEIVSRPGHGTIVSVVIPTAAREDRGRMLQGSGGDPIKLEPEPVFVGVDA